MWQVTVDKEKCTGDEECVDICPVDVFEMVDGKAEPVNMEDCEGCESCVEVCEEDAITVEEV
jgi:NAD-dependent dihydropyrimidine dehydrogenase PreA subunit